MAYYENLKVLISGGTSGIGYAWAKLYALKGAKTIIVIGIDNVEETVVSLKKYTKEDQQVFGFHEDVLNLEQLKKLFITLEQQNLAPNLLINCAGIGVSYLFEETSQALFEKVMAVNVFGSRNIVEAALPMLKKNKGHIVLVASLAGYLPNVGYTAYGTSKYAVRGLAEVLRLEMKPKGLTVSMVAPPEIDTPLVQEERKTINPAALEMKLMAGVVNLEEAVCYFESKVKKRKFLIIPNVKGRLFERIMGIFPHLFRIMSDRLYIKYFKD